MTSFSMLCPPIYFHGYLYILTNILKCCVICKSVERAQHFERFHGRKRGQMYGIVTQQSVEDGVAVVVRQAPYMHVAIVEAVETGKIGRLGRSQKIGMRGFCRPKDAVAHIEDISLAPFRHIRRYTQRAGQMIEEHQMKVGRRCGIGQCRKHLQRAEEEVGESIVALRPSQQQIERFGKEKCGQALCRSAHSARLASIGRTSRTVSNSRPGGCRIRPRMWQAVSRGRGGGGPHAPIRQARA